MAKVIIAEKPSVARNIAEAVGAKNKKDGYLEGKDYIVTWAFGHLLELYDAKEYDEKMTSWKMENFPFIPEQFKYRVKYASDRKSGEDEGAAKQIKTIESLMSRKDVSGVISACDYDREGQIIGDIILDYLHGEQVSSKSQERLLLNEWTPKEVQKGLEKLIPNQQMKSLKDAGISRQWADWVIGINLTSVATLKYQRGWTGSPLNIGRVLLPTLKIIYDRDKEIENFVPEEYSKLTGTFQKQGKYPEDDKQVSDGELVYEGVYTEESGDKFPDKQQLKELAKRLKGKTGQVTDKKVEKKNEYPPGLFNLSGLQGYVTGKYKGWTSEKVLKVAQELYEKKFITYPRTASVALEESLKEKAEKVLAIIKKGLPYEAEVRFQDSKRVFNNEKVESHSAIMPTYIQPKNLPPDHQKVYQAIVNRFIMQFMPVAEYEEGTLITTIVEGDLAGHFVSKGRIQRIKGWKKVEDIQSKDKELPPVEVGDEVLLESAKVETKATQPPKKHTEKSLLRVMETCGKKYKGIEQKEPDEENSDSEGADSEETEMDDETLKAVLSGFSIGTPATRAETIKKLKTAGYITMSGKSLVTTGMGRKLVELFPVKELFDLEYTGRLEKSLSDMEKGNHTKEDFLAQIFDFTKDAVAKIKQDQFHIISQGKISERSDLSGEVLGKCPACGSDVIEKDKSYSCTNWRGGCKFVLWKEDRFLTSLKVQITKAVVKSLLEKGAVYSDRFVSKKGNKFAAILTYEKNTDNDYYNWKMHFKN